MSRALLMINHFPFILINLIIPDLLGFTSILFSVVHFFITSISFIACALDFQMHTMSSDYPLVSISWILYSFNKSFLNKLNNTGDSQEPCTNPLYVLIIFPLYTNSIFCSISCTIWTIHGEIILVYELSY